MLFRGSNNFLESYKNFCHRGTRCGNRRHSQTTTEQSRWLRFSDDRFGMLVAAHLSKYRRRFAFALISDRASITNPARFHTNIALRRVLFVALPHASSSKNLQFKGFSFGKAMFLNCWHRHCSRSRYKPVPLNRENWAKANKGENDMLWT
ncbi:MAG: hypothetical protein ACR2GW_14515, partial [Pyrinomonadaceae bacterium]